jgi:hypothetical protein
MTWCNTPGASNLANLGITCNSHIENLAPSTFCTNVPYYYVALNFVDDHQTFQLFQSEHRVCKPGLILWVFEVELGYFFVDGLGKVAGEGRFSHLTGTDNSDYAMPFKQALQVFHFLFALNHDFFTLNFRLCKQNFQGDRGRLVGGQC